ncbi:MAG TPA: alanine--tRNA ligase, partial [Thermotogales bacterium]|nr:alanine--tRNA ligase [Thermotogales bacterium]
GQVSDTGLILSDDSQAEVFYVFSPTENLILHRARILKGKFKVGDDVKLKVDERRRLDTMRNHTATHLLHSALRRILGDHVKQAGSFVAPDRLRFDFTHHRILSEDELRKIEGLVNEKILESIQVDVEYKTLDEAKKLGAIALFEEKYGEYVRVVKIGDFSMELCGGTHVKNTSELGFFMITHEGSISSGVRRIEAVTGRMALRILEDMKKVLKNLSKTLEVGWRDVPSKLEKIMLENRNLKKRIREMEEKMISSAEAVHPEIEEISKVKILKLILENSDDSTVRNTADVMMNRLKSGVVIIFNRKNGRISFVVKLSEDLTKFLDASIIAREMAKILGGGGGGRKDFAQAGGKYPDKLNEAFEKAKTMIMSAIG